MGFQINEALLLHYPREHVFGFFSDAGNLDRLTPPWLGFSIRSKLPIELAQGTVVRYGIRIRGVPMNWESEITDWRPPFEFCDVQRKGPYRYWIHRHIFEEAQGGTLVTDRVDYAVYGGALVNRLFVARDLMKIFEYRKAKLIEQFP